MNRKDAAEAHLGIDELVSELLGLDPAALIALDPDKQSVLAGLHAFMRETLRRALGLLWAPDGSVIRLRSDASALGWDTRAWNLSSLFVYALLLGPRRARGRADLALLPADDRIVDLPRPARAGDSITAVTLAVAAKTLLKEDIGARRSEPDFGASRTAPIRTLVSEYLRLGPTDLVRPLSVRAGQAKASGSLDPDEQVAEGLAALLMSAVERYLEDDAQDASTIRLRLRNGTCGKSRADARQAIIATLLIAGLLADGRRRLAFIVWKSTSPNVR